MSYTVQAAEPNASPTVRGVMVPADKVKLDAITGTNSGDVTLGAVGSTPNANGASLVGQVLTLQPASASFPGAMTNGAQVFAGAKTFNDTITSGVASGANGFALATGARLHMGGTTYVYSDGTKINFACDVTMGDLTTGTNLYTTVIRGGNGYINMHPSAGIAIDPVDSGKIDLYRRVNLIPGGTTAGATPSRAMLSFAPQNAEPTGPNAVGDMYVTTAGVLKICTVAGSPGTWVSVGTQT